ncbi:MAG: hypothetical protein HRU19_31420 [Pseudobacteriovorax sp.]|nr:hypothetical protein [Pseudobacteriovorax sp.]
MDGKNKILKKISLLNDRLSRLFFTSVRKQFPHYLNSLGLETNNYILLNIPTPFWGKNLQICCMNHEVTISLGQEWHFHLSEHNYDECVTIEDTINETMEFLENLLSDKICFIFRVDGRKHKVVGYRETPLKLDFEFRRGLNFEFRNPGSILYRSWNKKTDREFHKRLLPYLQFKFLYRSPKPLRWTAWKVRQLFNLPD